MKLSEVFPSMLCRSSFAQHGKSMPLQNHIEYFKKKSEFAQRLRLDPEMKRIQNLTRTNGGAAQSRKYSSAGSKGLPHSSHNSPPNVHCHEHRGHHPDYHYDHHQHHHVQHLGQGNKYFYVVHREHSFFATELKQNAIIIEKQKNDLGNVYAEIKTKKKNIAA